jgi:drug/metabolite transporter (DMT)-like permease
MGLVINFPLALYFAFQEPNFLQLAPTISVSTWVALLFLGLVSAFIANFFWYNGLALGGIARVGQVQLLQPFMTFLAASLFLPEPITLVNILFATAVVAVVMIGRKMPIRKVESKSAAV